MKALTQRFKIIFLGDQQVGKTSIISRYINGSFDEHSVLFSK